jgi:allantoinase
LKCLGPGDFIAAWGGVASLELSLRATWSGASVRGFGILDVIRWMSAAPAALCGLDDRKGAIRPGADADLILFDSDARTMVDAERLQQRHKVTPYSGIPLRGAVRATYVRGVRVWEADKLACAGTGRLL